MISIDIGAKVGNILGVDIELTPSVSFEFGQENNNTMDAKSYGKLTVKLPLGNKQKFTNFSIELLPLRLCFYQAILFLCRVRRSVRKLTL
jgi:hypothetical protein